MNSKLLNDAEQRTYAVVFDAADEVVAGLTEFARAERLTASHFSGIGAFSDVTLGFFDVDEKDYARNSIAEQVEIVSLIGNIACKDGNPKVHAHVVVAKRDATAHGGHLLEAHVRPTLELIVTESPAHLRRETDDATGLPLIAIGGRS